jgi:hypothetical protein
MIDSLLAGRLVGKPAERTGQSGAADIRRRVLPTFCPPSASDESTTSARAWRK